MSLYILKRLLILIPTLLGVMTLSFIITQFVPGGPVDHVLATIDSENGRGGNGDGIATGSSFNYSARNGITPKQIDQLTNLYGFDKPLHERFFSTIKNLLTFNLGESYYQHQSVGSLIKEKLGVSIALGTWTFLLTYLVSVPLGIAKAIRAGSRFDTISSLIVLIGYAMPGFILGVCLIVLFGGGSFWDIFPLRGLTSDNWDELSFTQKILDYLWHVTLPVVSSAISLFAIKTLLTKNMFLDEISKNYVLTAKAKGLSHRRILWKHVFRNTLLPLITGFPATFIGAFFTGSLLIETLFSLDGLGLLSFESVNNRDYPVVLGSLYLFTLIGLLLKLLGDIAYVLADPRIKYSAQFN